jgi:hypothetical protein
MWRFAIDSTTEAINASDDVRQLFEAAPLFYGEARTTLQFIEHPPSSCGGPV